jgi:small redox-active disulfide protein 2
MSFDEKKEKCSIKVLGSGCKNCETLLKNTKDAVKKMNLEADVEYITDMQEVMKYGVMSMPALAVNGKVVSAGRVCRTEDVANILHKIGY